MSLKGVTGAGNLDPAEVARKLAAIRRHITLPVGVGFGIRDAASARAIAAHADAVVIGSRMIQEIENGAPDGAAARAGAWLAGIRARSTPRRGGADAAVARGKLDAVRARRAGPIGRTTMSWLQKLLPPRIKRTPGGRKQGGPRGAVGQVPVVRGGALPAPTSRRTSTSARSAATTRGSRARERLDQLLDAEGRFEIGSEVLPIDSLKFKDTQQVPGPPRRRRWRRPARPTRWS